MKANLVFSKSQLFLIGLILFIANSCTNGTDDWEEQKKDPFKVIESRPLTDKIPYDSLGSGKIVFDRVRFSSYASGFYVIDIDKKKSWGFNLNSLTRDPYISPDGSKIACTILKTGDYNSDWNVYNINTDGTNCINISHLGFEYYPTWTPDGTKIIFYKNGGPLYIVSAIENAADEAEIVKFRYNDNTPWLLFTWGRFSMSSNGKVICDSRTSTFNGIIAIEPYIGKPGVSTFLPAANNERILSPVFSPDGTKIAFGVSEQDTISHIFKNIIVKTIDSDGANLSKVAKVNIYNTAKNWAGYNNTFSLCWSPDGKKILFTALNKENEGYHIMVVNADGTGLTQVTDESDAYDYDISWGR